MHKDSCLLGPKFLFNRAPDPERVAKRALKVLDLVVGAHVEDDEEDEGPDDLEEQVHPEDVDAYVPLVDAELRRPQHDHRPVGLGQRRVDQLVAGVVGGDALGVELEELGHVVDQGEGQHGDHEGPRRVHVPANRNTFSNENPTRVRFGKANLLDLNLKDEVKPRRMGALFVAKGKNLRASFVSAFAAQLKKMNDQKRYPAFDDGVCK